MLREKESSSKKMVVVVAEEAVVRQKRHQATQQQRIRATYSWRSTERSIAASWPLVGPWLVAFVYGAVVVVLCRVQDPLLKAPMPFYGLLLVWNRLCCSMMTILVRI